MSSCPKVSVIIPSYNRKLFLLEAIRSVFRQTYRNIELIVVDDGSCDDSASFIKDYYKSEDRLIYIYRKQNRGVSAARNLGMQHSNASFIAFLDSDDIWHKDKLLYQVDLLMARPYYKAVYTNEVWLRNGIHLNQKKRHTKYSGFIYRRCLPLCIISPSSILIKRELIDRVGLFDETMPVCEDYDYWLRLTSLYPIFFMDRKLITKRAGHANQLSFKYNVMDSFRISSLVKLLSLNILNKEDRERTKDELVSKISIVREGLIKRERLKTLSFYDAILKSL